MAEDAGRCKEVAENWLQNFTQALSNKDADTASSLFHPEGWLRDVLVLSWDTRSLQGRGQILEYLQTHLSKAVFDGASFKIDNSAGLAPSLFKLAEEYNGIETAFAFKTPIIHGRGFMRLIVDEADAIAGKKWKALSVFITTSDIVGHEENLYEYGIYGDHTIAWGDVNASRTAEVEKDPLVLVGTSWCIVTPDINY